MGPAVFRPAPLVEGRSYAAEHPQLVRTRPDARFGECLALEPRLRVSSWRYAGSTTSLGPTSWVTVSHFDAAPLETTTQSPLTHAARLFKQGATKHWTIVPLHFGGLTPTGSARQLQPSQ